MSADELTRLAVLRNATVEIEGRMPWSSNATFRCFLLDDDGGRVGQAIYKPLHGERPLWDFEPGLHRREVAAYRLSAATCLGLVPPTILRDGPLGEGSLQWYVEADHQQHYFTLYEARSDLHQRLAEFAFFDLLVNNTDRKSGHVLIDSHGSLWGIDHGLCFSADTKVRTVIWEFGGTDIPPHLLAIALELCEAVPREVAELLADDEVDAIRERAAWLLDRGTFPVDRGGRAYPWPLI